MRTQALAAALLLMNVSLFVDLTLFQFPNPHAVPNFVPLHTICDDLHKGGEGMVVNFLGNLAIFAPIGFLLPMVWNGRRAALPVAIFAMILSGTIETLQYFSGRRVADVDDVLLNTLGALLGYLFFEAFSWIERLLVAARHQST